MRRNELVNYLNSYLRLDEIDDYGPQGLQVEAETTEVKRLALAVDTSPAGIQAAADWRADMLLVHHGLFWRTVERLAGPLGHRVRLLLKHNIHLYAAHLPLDAHPEVGNNAVLARMFGITVEEWWCKPTNVALGALGSAPAGLTLDTLVSQVNDKLNTTARVVAHGPSQVSKVAIVSGFGADKAAEARQLGADTFLTGETSHTHFWAADDYGLNLIYGGHYATETVGVKALGQHLAETFGLRVKFIDLPTGM